MDGFEYQNEKKEEFNTSLCRNGASDSHTSTMSSSFGSGESLKGLTFRRDKEIPLTEGRETVKFDPPSLEDSFDNSDSSHSSLDECCGHD